MIELFRGHGEEYLRLRTPVRFDFDPDAAAERHPASHLSLNDQDCRIPVRGPMSLGHFIEFVFRHFYSSVWAKHDFLADTHREPMSRMLTPEHEAWIHLDWWTGAETRGCSQSVN